MIDPHLHNFIVNQSVIILNEKGEVLMGLRAADEENHPGKWTIPGGKLDSTDNSLIDGLKREVLEETGVELKDVTLFESHVRAGIEKNVIYIVYTAKLASGIAQALEDTERVEWFDIESLPSEDQCTPHTHTLIIQKLSAQLS